jgi:adenylyltransferase/sulfurtransferase
MMDRFGVEGQERLKRARVFVAGAGGLGSPVSIYLAVAGVGKLCIVDRDTVELSNLNRQILHWDKDIGGTKASSAGEKLRQMNPNIAVETIVATITEDNISQLAEGYDLIVDAMDNFPTRYLLNKTAVERKIPLFHGGIYGMSGIATTIIPGVTPCLRCIFPEAPPPEKFPVVGVAPAIIGCIQATEVIKYIVGIGNLLTNRLLIFDGLNSEFREVKLSRAPSCRDCAFIWRQQEGS